ncbi:MAG: exosortase system-associated protein, TIGR04073 family [Candidatus Omnitrophica bacterium]|nr:exosortase system-associated protein, TIGR04073 family [Candidatus Omnitrophota bacterium]MDD5653602.1 exosortase system-associated protein, TIGR04073 family [Candidatus Omnitrophota bacterium]
MKKLLVLLCAALFIFPVAISTYAQVEESAISASPLMQLRQHQVNPLALDKDIRPTTFLDGVNAEADTYTDTPIDKMSDGVLNTTTAWTDIPKRVSTVSQESNIVAGVVVGFSEGLVNGMARGASGVIDIATCGVPPYDEPLMKPEYKVKKPQQDGFKINLLKW